MFYQLEPGTALAREQQRLSIVRVELDRRSRTIPILKKPSDCCLLVGFTDLHLGFLDQNRFWFKSAVGLSRLGLMNQLAQDRQLPSVPSAPSSGKSSGLAINDTQNPAFTSCWCSIMASALAEYPALVDGHCLGASK